MVATAEEKGKATEAAEKKVQSTEKAQLMAENILTEMEVKLGGMEFKLAKADSLNLAQADKIIDLKVALEACEEKWYNVGFTEAENSVEPIVNQARHHGFGKGWLESLQAMRVVKVSPLRNPEQI